MALCLSKAPPPTITKRLLASHEPSSISLLFRRLACRRHARFSLASLERCIPVVWLIFLHDIFLSALLHFAISLSSLENAKYAVHSYIKSRSRAFAISAHLWVEKDTAFFDEALIHARVLPPSVYGY